METTIISHSGFQKYVKMSDKMSDREKEFLKLLIKELEHNEFVTTTQMSNTANVLVSTVRRYMAKFCEWGIIVSDGKNRGAKYYLV